MKALNITLVIICLTSIVYTSLSFKLPRFPVPSQKAQSLEEGQNVRYQTLYFDQKVSHFNFRLARNTFKQKFLMDMTNWDKNSRGPILMYCGN